MRILYLHQHFASRQSNGGTRTFEFARRLIDRGHQVHVVTGPAYLAEPYQPRRLAHPLRIEGVPATVLRVPYANRMGFAERTWAFLLFALLATREALRRRADLVLAVSTPLTIAIPGIAARLGQRIPMVFEVGDLWPELPIAMGALRNPLARLAARGLEYAAYHAAAHIIALSPGMAAGVIRRGIPAERVSVIPNSCDFDLFDVPAERGLALRRRLGLAAGQPLVVYAGTFGRINGVGYLADVAAAMRRVDPRARFLLVGAGAEHAAVCGRARELGVLDANLWVWDGLPKEQIPDLLSAATVATSVFIPLREMWHNSANKFFDALAAGRPVAINYEGWQADLLRECGAGLVLPAADPGRAARLLADLWADPGGLARAGAAARRLGRERFSRDRQAAELEQILSRVARA